MGNNPTAPYVIPSVPLWQDEYADGTMRDLLGPTANHTWWTHRFDPREAIVILGLLPPHGRYFGIQSYAFSRQTSLNTSDSIYRAATDPFMKNVLFLGSPNPSRLLVFSSLGDSQNNVTIERQSGGAFEQERSFIITPDAVMERNLRGALLQAGVPDQKQIFTEPVSADIARLGLDAPADDFMTLIRYALPANEAAGNDWRKHIPLVIFRVRDRNTARATEPYPAPVLEDRVANSELGLKGDADRLVEAVKLRWGQPTAPTSSFFSLRLAVDLLGKHCLLRPMNCLGDSSDADYQASATEGLDSGQVLAVVGTLGTATGNAIYTSLSLNWLPPLKGVANITDEALTGSASSYFAPGIATDKFYLHYFARDCRNLRNCLTVTPDLVPVGHLLKIIQRNYIVPGSNRGPDPSRVLNPTLVVLNGSSRPSEE
jgi:hypothetical protein